MNLSELPSELSAIARTAQIIVAALAMGVIFFGLIVVLAIQPTAIEGMPVLSIAAVAAALPTLGMAAILPSLIVNAMLKRMADDQQAAHNRTDANALPASAAESLLRCYITKTILIAAPLEGAAFFQLIAYLVEGQWWSLLVALMLVVGILLQFPTATRIQHWIENQLQKLKHMREGSTF